MGNFAALSGELLADLKAYQQEQYNFWSKDLEETLDNPDSPLVLQMSGRLMEFDFSDGTLKVNYSEKLVTLLQEVRQLTALGYKISRKVRGAADNAQKFHRHGIILKQVANFYNTIKVLYRCELILFSFN